MFFKENFCLSYFETVILIFCCDLNEGPYLNPLSQLVNMLESLQDKK